MYSYEIDKYLKDRKYKIHVSEYDIVCNTESNPQISFIKYNPYSQSFSMKTKDEYEWEFWVYK